MSTQNWVPPLPPGIEARWDPNHKAYFYINHKTKQTSWQDPRPEYYAQLPKDHPPPNPRPQPPQTPVFGFRGSVKKSDDGNNKVGMLKQQFPDVDMDTLKLVLKIKGNNIAEARNHLKNSGHRYTGETDHSSAGQLQMENIVKSLQKQYPLARYDIIRDIVVGCNNNESSARSQLESMGYQAVGGQRSTLSSAGSSSLSESTSRSTTRTPSPTLPSPPPPKVPDAEKRRVTNKMKGEFKDLGDAFIKMALETVNYDENKFRRMVEHYKSERAGGSATGRKKVDDEISFKPTASLAPEAFAGGNEPVVFGHDEEEMKGASSSSIPFETTDVAHKPTGTTFTVDVKGLSSKSRQTSPKKTVNSYTTSRERLAPPKKTVVKTSGRTSSRETIDQHAARLRAQKNQPRAKEVTHSTTTHEHVVHTQPRSSLARGPDPTLRRGPNKDHLLTEYVNAVGPNPDHYSGPDSSRARGSQGAYGPDPSLVCGAQAQHANSYINHATPITAV